MRIAGIRRGWWIGTGGSNRETAAAGCLLAIWIGDCNGSGAGCGTTRNRDVERELGRIVDGDAVDGDATTIDRGLNSIGKPGTRIEKAGPTA